MKLSKLMVIVSLAAMLSMFGCSSGSDDSFGGRLRFIHASPDAPTLELIVDGDTREQGIQYLQTVDYFNLSAETHNLVAKEDQSFTVLANTDLFVEDEGDYSFIITGSETNPVDLLFADINSKPQSDRVRLRILHTAPSLTNVDVYITAPGVSLTDVVPAISDFGFGESSGYSENAEGIYQVRVTPIGSKVPFITSTDIDMQSGQVLSVLIVDAPGGGAPFGTTMLLDRD